MTGKDSLVISDGIMTIDSGKDGLKSSNETDEGKGNITVNVGTININIKCSLVCQEVITWGGLILKR